MAFIFVGLYHWIYSTYVNPIFEYAHYEYYSHAIGLYVLSYLFAVAPVFFSTNRKNPATYGAALLYVFCYAPAQMTILFMWARSEISLIFLQASLAASMSAFFYISKYKVSLGLSKNFNSSNNKGELTFKAKKVIFILTLLFTISLILGNWSHMRLVGFDDVYDLRFDARDAEIGGVSGYFILWLTTFIIPYYAANGVFEKRKWQLCVAALLGLISYMANGAKISLLMPYAIMIISLMYMARGNFLSRLLLYCVAVLFMLVLIDSPGLDLVKSLLIMRTLSTGGWTMITYYEFFTNNGFTYYSHVRIIDAIFGLYQYGDYSLGQLIGMEYSGSSDANFNANFWASDGIAALGTIGIIPVTIFLMMVMLMINAAGDHCDKRLLAIWLTGFWMALLNSPLTTSLFSGGAILILMLVWYSGRSSSRTSKLIHSKKGALVSDDRCLQAVPLLGNTGLVDLKHKI